MSDNVAALAAEPEHPGARGAVIACRPLRRPAPHRGRSVAYSRSCADENSSARLTSAAEEPEESRVSAVKITALKNGPYKVEGAIELSMKRRESTRWGRPEAV